MKSIFDSCNLSQAKSYYSCQNKEKKPRCRFTYVGQFVAEFIMIETLLKEPEPRGPRKLRKSKI